MVRSKPSILNSNTQEYQRPAVPLRTTDQTAVPQRVLNQIAKAMTNIRGWGSVEIIIQDHKVTQITERNILKTDASLYTDEFRS